MELTTESSETEFQQVPDDWEWKLIGHLMSLQNGVNADGEAYGSGTPFINVLEVITNSHLQITEIPGKVELPDALLNNYLVRKGDILFNRTSETQEEVGLASVYLEDDPVVFGGFVIRGQLQGDQLDTEYAGYALRASTVRSQIVSRAQGAVRANIGQQELAKVSVPLPPLPEQRAIADALSDVDALIERLDALIAKKRAIKTATMQRLLTGQQRLPGFSAPWTTKRLGEIGKIEGSGVDKKVVPDQEDVRLINYMDVYNRDFIDGRLLDHWVTASPSKLRRCGIQKGDVFFTPSSEVRDDIAHSAVATKRIPDAVFSYHVMRLRIQTDWDLHFRAYAFKTKSFYDQASKLCAGSGTRYTITKSKFESMSVKVPQRNEQRAIATVLTDMDAEIEALQARRDKTQDIKQGMMQELLTGRTRLV